MCARRVSLTLITLSLVVLLSGCTMGQFHRLSPNSHFAYPNSNVKDLGPVNIKVPGTVSFLMMPNHMTSEIDQKVYNAALAQVDGADLILDYVRTTTIKWCFFVLWTDEYLEGTAARMEVGQQRIR